MMEHFSLALDMLRAGRNAATQRYRSAIAHMERDWAFLCISFTLLLCAYIIGAVFLFISTQRITDISAVPPAQQSALNEEQMTQVLARFADYAQEHDRLLAPTSTKPSP